jgi:hypothetical protein
MSAQVAPQASSDDRGLLAASVRVPDHVVHRAFVNETVVLNLQTGQYHGLNPVGGRMLEALEREPTVEDAVRRLTDEFGEVSPEELQRDVRAFCADLLRRGLIELEANGHG